MTGDPFGHPTIVAQQTDTRVEQDPDVGTVDSPTDLSKRSWGYVLRKTVREFSGDLLFGAELDDERRGRAIRLGRRAQHRSHGKG